MSTLEQAVLGTAQNLWKQVFQYMPNKGEFPFHTAYGPPTKLTRIKSGAAPSFKIEPVEGNTPRGHTTYMKFHDCTIDGHVRTISQTFIPSFTGSAQSKKFINEGSTVIKPSVTFEIEHVKEELESVEKAFDFGISRTIEGSGTVGIASVGSSTTFRFDWHEQTRAQNTRRTTTTELVEVPGIKVQPGHTVKVSEIRHQGVHLTMYEKSGLLECKVEVGALNIHHGNYKSIADYVDRAKGEFKVDWDELNAVRECAFRAELAIEGSELAEFQITEASNA